MTEAVAVREQFNTRVLTLIAVAIVINIVGGQINDALHLPVFLDSFGTILVGLLAGPIAGGAAGLLTNLIWGLITNPVAAAFAPVALVIGVATGLLARFGLFRQIWQVVISGVIIAAVLTVVAVPIQVYLFGGVTGAGSDFAVAYFSQLGQTLFSSVALTVFGSNVADKVITAVIVWLIVKRLPERLTHGFSHLKYTRG
ncbi:ECF transporter S component [Oryzibacter oryziterrae]|uniref:ECF transporter S component n=1 Tax=Oryzibacter oryziterrae TaxID=2766474 RepID=UPI001F02146E|nr:ECF transporter S component [Oryzibacter oryziterrae]